MTDSTNIDNALAYLGTSLKTLIESSQKTIDLKTLPGQLAKRSLSGDHINGGKIINFSSSGIEDRAKDTQIVISNDTVSIRALSVETVQGNLSVENIIRAESITVAGTIKANKIEVAELTSDLRFERSASLEFKVPTGEKLNGKGLLWIGEGHTKQFILSSDKFFSSESIDLLKDRNYCINGIPVLGSTELGSSITVSNLRKVGTLQGLLINGNVSIDQYIFYSAVTSRLGVGIENPNAGFSVAEDGIEVILGSKNQSNGVVGTYASIPFDIVTDNTSRISVSASGDIKLGNRNSKPIEVNIHGKLAVGVNTADDRVDLHVAGSIKFNEHIHQYDVSPPQHGVYTKGDIVWNTNPEMGKFVGWTCVRAGSPGTWLPFGEIKPQIR